MVLRKFVGENKRGYVRHGPFVGRRMVFCFLRAIELSFQGSRIEGSINRELSTTACRRDTSFARRTLNKQKLGGEVGHHV